MTKAYGAYSMAVSPAYLLLTSWLDLKQSSLTHGRVDESPNGAASSQGDPIIIVTVVVVARILSRVNVSLMADV